MTTAAEFLAVLRQALSGTPVTFAGEQLSSAGFRATMKAPVPVPVLLAAMNPAMLRQVGADTVDALCAIGTPETVAAYVRALRAAGVILPVVLTPGRNPATWPGHGPRSPAWPRLSSCRRERDL